MTLVIIFGPPAVGKMAVGMELARLTGFKLFHNHMTVDAVMPVFPFESASYTKLVQEFRERVFEEFAAHGERGLIFTFVWVLDDEADRPEDDGHVRATGRGRLLRRIGGDAGRTPPSQRDTAPDDREAAAAQHGRLARVPARRRQQIPHEHRWRFLVR